jgi:hypothetical protein
VNKNLLSGIPPCFGKHVKPLVPPVFAFVSTHQSALGPACAGRPVPQQWEYKWADDDDEIQSIAEQLGKPIV